MELSFDNNFMDRVKNNLDKNNLTFEDFKTFKYAGGDFGHHLNYYKILFGDKKLPNKEVECLCGHPIKNNCYIVNEENENLMVLGNCCIKRFLSKSGRTCDKCGEPHKTRKNNYCKSCNDEENKKRDEQAKNDYIIRKKEIEKENRKLEKRWLLVKDWMTKIFKENENSFSQLSNLLKSIESQEFLPDETSIYFKNWYRMKMNNDKEFKTMKNKLFVETKRINASIKYKKNYRTMKP
jgi:hypothetical protein